MTTNVLNNNRTTRLTRTHTPRVQVIKPTVITRGTRVSPVTASVRHLLTRGA